MDVVRTMVRGYKVVYVFDVFDLVLLLSLVKSEKNKAYGFEPNRLPYQTGISSFWLCSVIDSKPIGTFSRHILLFFFCQQIFINSV